MRTKFTVSMAAAGALLATAAIPNAVESSSTLTEATSAIERQLFAGPHPMVRRPLVARVEELTNKESA
jgi:hypothetical protein